MAVSVAGGVACTSNPPGAAPPISSQKQPGSVSASAVASAASPACVVTMRGVSSNGRVLSGNDQTTLNAAAGTYIHVTGSVTDKGGPFPEEPLDWNLGPLASGTSPASGTAEIDATWIAPKDQRTLGVELKANADETRTYEWDLQLSAENRGCLPATPQACIQAGGNFFSTEPVVVGGRHLTGCYDAESCIADIPVRLGATSCSADDILVRARAEAATYLASLDGKIIAVVERDQPPMEVGSPFGNGVIAATEMLTISGESYQLVIPTTTPQGTAAVLADPGVVQDVLKRNPQLAEKNPGFTVP